MFSPDNKKPEKEIEPDPEKMTPPTVEDRENDLAKKIATRSGKGKKK